MDKLYNGHFIRSGAEPVPDNRDWKPSVEVRWGLAGKDQVKRWSGCDFARSFAGKRVAFNFGQLFARQWIDSGRVGSNMEEV